MTYSSPYERARRAAERGTTRRPDVVSPALLTVATLAAFERGASEAGVAASDGSDPGDSTGRPPSRPDSAPSWTPTRSADVPAVVEGAVLAVSRFDADVDRAAALAGVSVATLRRRVE